MAFIHALTSLRSDRRMPVLADNATIINASQDTTTAVTINLVDKSRLSLTSLACKRDVAISMNTYMLHVHCSVMRGCIFTVQCMRVLHSVDCYRMLSVRPFICSFLCRAALLIICRIHRTTKMHLCMRDKRWLR